MSNNKPVEMAPVLQTMPEYIDNHFCDELMEELEAVIALDHKRDIDLGLEELSDDELRHVKLVFERSAGKIVRFDLWRKDRTLLKADMKARFRVGISQDDQIPHYVVRYINFSADFSLDGGIQRIGGITDVTTEAPPKREMPKLSKFLVPVLSYEEMECMVLEMLKKYLGKDAIKKYQVDGAKRLAAAMGLEIMSVSLHRNHHTAAMLFLKEGSVRVTESGATGSGTDDEDYQEIPVPAKTIIVNENVFPSTDVEQDIYHECGHYEWHSMFFELQELHSADLQLLEYQEADKASKPAEKDIRWVERQAAYVSYAGIFPKPVLMPMVQEYWQEVANSSANIGKKISHVIYRISTEKQKRRSLVKTRLIMLGSAAAKGACNYVDGDYIQPFAFNPERLGPGETFVIGRAQFTEMYEKDEDFRELICTHQFIYADGHICANMPRFIRQTSKGAELTDWALAHLDECCLKFKKDYRTSYRHYKVGELHSDQEYNEVYVMIHSMQISGMTPDDIAMKNVEYIENFPRTPNKALDMLIRDRVKTKRELAFRSGLSETMISRMCKDRDFKYDIQQVTRLVIGLHLPPLLSSMLLELTGFSRASMARHYRYQCIIDCMFMDDMETVLDTHADLFDN